MKRYQVNVNGTNYDITIEEVDASAVQAAPAPAAAPAPTPAPAPAAAPTAAPAGGREITSPMPGTILAVNVTPGQSVKQGDVLVVLEAMKMENEIMADADGTVGSVLVTKGQSVDSGAVLCTLA